MKTSLAIGDGISFVGHLLALSSLVALIVASQALREVVAGSLPAVGGSGPALIEATLLGEVDSVLSTWLVPTWLLVAAAAFVVTLDSSKSFQQTSALLSELGAGKSVTSRLLYLRGGILVSLSFVVGLSLGSVAAQVVFRAFLVLLGAQYYVPEVSPTSLGFAAILSLSSLALGSGTSVIVSRRGS